MRIVLSAPECVFSITQRQMELSVKRAGEAAAAALVNGAGSNEWGASVVVFVLLYKFSINNNKV